MNQSSGFTLLEVMIALMILVIAMMAVIVSVNQSVSNLNYLKDKTAATWVAANVINDVQSGLLSVNTQGSNQQGTMQMFDKQWTWSLNANATANANVLHIEVKVFAPGGKTNLITFNGYTFNAAKH